MTREMNFSETAKTFNENVAKGMKWMEETSSKLIETQQQQMNKQLDSFNEQVADLALVNQTNFDAIVNQFETATKSFEPLTEQFKKEMENTMGSSKEVIQTIIESYSPFSTSMKEANETSFGKWNDQIKSGTDLFTQFWSNLLNSQNPVNAKEPEAKTSKEPLKISANHSNKKHANESHAI